MMRPALLSLCLLATSPLVGAAEAADGNLANIPQKWVLDDKAALASQPAEPKPFAARIESTRIKSSRIGGTRIDSLPDHRASVTLDDSLSAEDVLREINPYAGGRWSESKPRKPAKDDGYSVKDFLFDIGQAYYDEADREQRLEQGYPRARDAQHYR